MHIVVVTGTTREGRFSEAVARWTLGYLSGRPEFTVEELDLRDHPLPFFDEAPPAYTKRDYPNEEIARLGRTIDNADGIILLTAEYNHGYTAVLKNAMDHTFVEWHRKPAAFIGWGNVGGARAIEQLRLVTVEFEMAPLRHAVHILPDVMLPVMKSDDPTDLSPFEPLEPKLAALTDDLLWWATALSTARAATAGEPASS
jgi:NAD(P)H-dependent FMN reductase